MPEFALSSCVCGQEKLNERFFRKAAENDFKAVDIVIIPGHFKGMREEVELVKKMVVGYQVKVESMHCDFEILDPPTIEIFKRAKEVILNNLDMLAELRGRFLVIHNYIFANPENIIVDEDGVLHPGLSLLRDIKNKNSGMLERIKDSMAFYALEAKNRGVSIALETEQNSVNGRLLDFISEADPENCGICFDTGHAQIASDAVESMKLLGSRVVCTHLHDNDGKKDLHLPPFKGVIDWEGVITELVKAGYKGTYTFECSGKISEIVEARQKFVETLNKVT